MWLNFLMQFRTHCFHLSIGLVAIILPACWRRWGCLCKGCFDSSEDLSSFATKIDGILDWMVQHKTRIWNEFLALCKNAEYLVIHNTKFWTSRLFFPQKTYYVAEHTTQTRIQTRLSTSDSTVEHQVLCTRTFDTIFEYSNFRVIDPSIRVVELWQDSAQIN